MLLFALVPVALLSLAVGDTPIADLYRRDPALAAEILVELRLPRLLLAAASGAVLAMSGAALQGFLRNPLASPDIVGASAGAALGAVATAYWLGVAGTIGMAAGGIAGALAMLALLLLLAGRGAATMTLILAGVALTSFAAAMMSVALTFAPSPFAVYDIMFWLLGSFADRSADHLLVGLPPMLIGGALLLSARRGLDALVLGEDVARTLGVNVDRMRVAIVAGSAIAIGGSVAVAGTIGFVGLVVPHLVRPAVGYRPGAAIVPSAFAGALLLVIADLATRIPVDGRTLPIGVLTALAGAPFFLSLILKRRREGLA
jgi:iron complex transport system permease protein